MVSQGQFYGAEASSDKRIPFFVAQCLPPCSVYSKKKKCYLDGNSWLSFWTVFSSYFIVNTALVDIWRLGQGSIPQCHLHQGIVMCLDSCQWNMNRSEVRNFCLACLQVTLWPWVSSTYSSRNCDLGLIWKMAELPSAWVSEGPHGSELPAGLNADFGTVV